VRSLSLSGNFLRSEVEPRGEERREEREFAHINLSISKNLGILYCPSYLLASRF
jgi:phosphopantetheinyl transferase